jgi:glycosyl transferase family 2
MTTKDPRLSSGARPAVSVVVPFRGDRGAAERMVPALECLDLRDGDELIVADNTSDGMARSIARDGIRVIPAARERSAYHARNEGARLATAAWILFLERPVPGDCGAVAGQILGEPGQESFAARYARSRNLFDHAEGMIRPDGGGAAAGNLLVRRAAFERIGGFTEGIRSGGDLDLCRRLDADGWRLEFRATAAVHHRHRATLPSLLGAVARYGAGSRWLNERYPGTSPPWPLRYGLANAARDVAGHAARGQVREAVFRGVDGLGLVAHRIGYATSNEAPELRQSTSDGWMRIDLER